MGEKDIQGIEKAYSNSYMCREGMCRMVNVATGPIRDGIPGRILLGCGQSAEADHDVSKGDQESPYMINLLT